MQSDLEVSAGVREGDLLAGKYRIDRILGTGAMGVVVAAHHERLDTRVAIKFLLPAMLANPQAVRRFAREARAAVRITSEHVARVLDVGTLETGAPYMVMEFLDGMDLSDWLLKHGPLPIDQAVDFVLQASVAVAEAHALGIVHRDLKPSNLFCIRRPDGQLSVKVLDFGISKVMGAGATGSDMSATRTNSIIGSPLYMSPEQMQSSKDVDSRADIWALGVIMYELVVGRVPFNGSTLAEVCTKITLREPKSPRTFRPDVPAGLDATILKCLEKGPENRYRNVAELALALLEFGSKRAKGSVERISGIIQTAGLSASALALPPSSDPTAEEAPESIAALGRTTSGIGGRRVVFVGTIALGSVLAGLAVAYGLKMLGNKPGRPLEAVHTTSAVLPPAATVMDGDSLWVPTTAPPGAVTVEEPAAGSPDAAARRRPFAPVAAINVTAAAARLPTPPPASVLHVPEAVPVASAVAPKLPASPPSHVQSHNPLDLPFK